jgi:hypothetical protein
MCGDEGQGLRRMRLRFGDHCKFLGQEKKQILRSSQDDNLNERAKGWACCGLGVWGVVAGSIAVGGTYGSWCWCWKRGSQQ